jgi:hypothetical protein
VCVQSVVNSSMVEVLCVDMDMRSQCAGADVANRCSVEDSELSVLVLMHVTGAVEREVELLQCFLEGSQDRSTGTKGGECECLLESCVICHCHT